jgi:hypothetical protein
MQTITDFLTSPVGAGFILGALLMAVVIVLYSKRLTSLHTRKELKRPVARHNSNSRHTVDLPEINVAREYPHSNIIHELLYSDPQNEYLTPVKRHAFDKREDTAVGSMKSAKPKSYDAFLSYASVDVSYVERIYEFLKGAGLKVWFDKESIRPGDDWLVAIQDGLGNSRSCLVFVRDEPGVWQQEETKSAIRRRTKNSSFKIIPIILPEMKGPEPYIPDFLKGTHWVDLRGGLFNMPILKTLVEAIRAEELVPIYRVPEEGQPDDPLPTGYRADVKKIISLLIGEALYSRRDVSIRELIQNAIDACERRRSSSQGEGESAEVVLKINNKEGYFEISDNGEGMSPHLLSEYFAVIGRSIRDEEDIMERAQENERARPHLIAKFGIGFISVYMLAKKVLISTTHEGEAQINLEINSISEPFIYEELSQVGRRQNDVGTTIRLYLKERALPNGEAPLDIINSVREFCRHVDCVKVIQDGTFIPIPDQWDIPKANVGELTEAPYKLKLHLGISKVDLSFIASNAGFLISNNPETIMPACMPSNIGGEVNFYPGLVDLNMARDTIIENNKSKQVRNLISNAIKSLLTRAATEGDMEILPTLKYILIAYLEESKKYEQALNTENQRQKNRNPSRRLTPPTTDPPPLSSVEIGELLLTVWRVELDGERLPLRDALTALKRKGKFRVYSSSYPSEFDKLLIGSLKKQGHLVITYERGHVAFRSGSHASFYGDEGSALEYLAKKYYFDLYSVSDPLLGDIEGLTVSGEALSTTLKKSISEIEEATGDKVLLSALAGAPIVFELGQKKYINIGNEVFKKLEEVSDNYDQAVLKSYMLGLLQYELSM